MAKAWTKGAWNEELLRIARDAANSRITKKNTAGYSQRKIEAIQKEYTRKAKEMLDEKYPFDKLDDGEKDAVASMKGDQAGSFLLSGGTETYRNSFDPLLKKRMDDFSKLGPLVLGLADEGRDWYSMGADDLFAKGKELGYDVSTKKGKMDFLRDVGNVQQAHERGKMLEEFNRENSVWSDLFYPTVMEEARKQITTGRGTQKQLDDAKTLDLFMNGMIGLLPILGDAGRAGVALKAASAASKYKPLRTLARSPIFKPSEFLDRSPVISGMLGAAAQGAAEAERQAYKEKVIDPELEADYTNALLALTTGATRPAMIGTASALSQQIPGQNASRIAAGISAATRRGNPANIEREELGQAFDIYNKLFRNSRAGTAAENIRKAADEAKKITADNVVEEQVKNLITGYGTKTKLSDLSKGRAAKKFEEQVKALYQNALEKGNKESDKMLAQATKERILSDYDNIANMSVYRNPSTLYDKVLKDYELVNGDKLKPGDYLAALEKAFPAKMAEAYGNDAWYKGGLRAGEILGTLGGSIEPALKANPLGPLSGGTLNIVDTDYKKTRWYKSLSKKQQEAFDDAYARSKKESE